MGHSFSPPTLGTGVSFHETPPRFTLSSYKFTDISNVVHEVQDILDSLIIEMDHRLTGYRVDPGGKLHEALEGTDIMPQLKHTWSFPL